MKKVFLPVCLIVAAFLLSACVGQNKKDVALVPTPVPKPVSVPTPTPEGLKVGIRKGNLAPDFQLKDLDGNLVRLSDFRGKVVFINFWATWCPYCRDEMASMERLYQEYWNKEFVILAVDIGGGGETINKIRSYITENNLTFPILIDFFGVASRRYRVEGIPASFILDQEGVIRQVEMGARDWDKDYYRRVILQLLGE